MVKLEDYFTKFEEYLIKIAPDITIAIYASEAENQNVKLSKPKYMPKTKLVKFIKKRRNINQVLS